MEIIGDLIIKQDFEYEPRLSISLKLPTGRWSPDFMCIIDTGFTGDILLSPNLFQIWSKKFERVPDDAEIGESVTGEIIQLRSLDTQLRIGEEIISVIVSSYSMVSENLIGWSVLKRYITVLDRDNVKIFAKID